MASGKPDWNRAVTIHGKYNSNWLPVLVDATGQMYIALTGQQVSIDNLPSDYFKDGESVVASGSVGVNNLPSDYFKDGGNVAIPAGTDVNNLPSDYFKDGGNVAIPAGTDVNNLPADYFKDGGNVAIPAGTDVNNLPSDYFKSGETVGSITNNVNVAQVDSDRVVKGKDGATARYVAVDATGVILARLKGAYSGSLYDVAVDANGVLLARMKGAYGGSLYDVALDANGYMIARMKGAYGETLKDVYVDDSGKMVARVQGIGGGDEQVFMIDDGGDTDDISDWTGLSDGLDPVDTTDYVKEGTHAMKLGLDASLSGFDYATWEGDKNVGDCGAFQHDWVYIWVYISDLTYVLASGTALLYEIGNDVDNHVGFNFTKADLVVGWNLLKCDLDNPDSTDGTVDWTAIDFQKIRIYAVAGNTHDFYLVLDSINFVRPNPSEGTLFDVLTDKDGMMLSKMVGSYADLVKAIAADRYGNMRVNIANWDHIGQFTADADSYTSTGAATTTLINITYTKGEIIGGTILLSGPYKENAYWIVTIDGVSYTTRTSGMMYYKYFMNPDAGIITAGFAAADTTYLAYPFKSGVKWRNSFKLEFVSTVANQVCDWKFLYKVY